LNTWTSAGAPSLNPTPFGTSVTQFQGSFRVLKSIRETVLKETKSSAHNLRALVVAQWLIYLRREQWSIGLFNLVAASGHQGENAIFLCCCALTFAPEGWDDKERARRSNLSILALLPNEYLQYFIFTILWPSSYSLVIGNEKVSRNSFGTSVFGTIR
jgi:hypothetical protein